MSGLEHAPKKTNDKVPRSCTKAARGDGERALIIKKASPTCIDKDDTQILLHMFSYQTRTHLVPTPHPCPHSDHPGIRYHPNNSACLKKDFIKRFSDGKHWELRKEPVSLANDYFALKCSEHVQNIPNSPKGSFKHRFPKPPPSLFPLCWEPSFYQTCSKRSPPESS
eukprot:7072768-Karenia_brevis.AAC.1